MTGDNKFWPSGNPFRCNGVPTTSYCGYMNPQDGFISRYLTGSGIVTLDYGNNKDQGRVRVSLDGQEVDMVVKIPF